VCRIQALTVLCVPNSPDSGLPDRFSQPAHKTARCIRRLDGLFESRHSVFLVQIRQLWECMWTQGWFAEVPCGEKMLYSGTDSESYITEYSLVCEEKNCQLWACVCTARAGAGGGLVFKAHRLLYHSTPGLRVIKQKKKCGRRSTGRRTLSRLLYSRHRS